jgi:hypothetical protein
MGKERQQRRAWCSKEQEGRDNKGQQNVAHHRRQDAGPRQATGQQKEQKPEHEEGYLRSAIGRCWPLMLLGVVDAKREQRTQNRCDYRPGEERRHFLYGRSGRD